MENIPLYIKKKTAEINDSDYTFESLFYAIHNQEDRIFAEFDESFRTVSVKYSEFKDYCFKAASFLNSKNIAESGDYVGLYMENSINWIACFWAILMLGKKPVLLNCKLPIAVNRNIVALLNINKIVAVKGTDCDLGAEVIFIENTCGLCKEFSDLENYVPEVWGNEIALTTTATSMNYKVCFYTGENFTHQVLNAKGILQKNKMVKKHYKGRLKQLTFLPFYHIFGLIATYFWFAAYGRTFVFLKDYSPNTILTTIRKHNITHLFAVPLLWNTIVREIKKEISALPEKDRKKAEKGIELSIIIQKIMPGLGMKISRRLFKQVISKTLGNSICFLISGGGYISEETLKTINAVGYPLYNGYGSTEIGITSVELRENIKYRLLGSVGKPFDSLKYNVKEDILYVKGLSTCSKILRKDGSETIVNHDEWYCTNDCAYYDKTGSYFLKGRCDDVILGANGEKLNPDLLEQKLLLTTVSEYSILGIDNIPSLILKIGKNTNAIQLKKITCEVEAALNTLSENGFEKPKCFYTTDEMVAKNAIKVSRKQLLSKISDGSVVLHPFSEITVAKSMDSGEVKSDIVLKIKAIIGEILEKDPSEIGAEQHFIFDLGGTSLDYCTLLIRLEKEFGTGVVKQGAMTVSEIAHCAMDCYERL